MSLHWRRSAALILTTAILLIATTGLSSASIADQEYAGVTSDLAIFKLQMFEGGDGVVQIEIGAPTNAFSNSCYEAGTIVPEGLVFDRGVLRSGVADHAVTDPSSGESRVLRISGRIYRDGIATGDASISGAANEDGIVCSPRSFSWAAVARISDEAPMPSAIYRGAVFAGPSFGGMREAGTAPVTISSDLGSLSAFVLSPTQTCSTADLSATATPLTNGVGTATEQKNVEAGTAYARYQVALSGRAGVGAFAIERDAAGCAPLNGVFILEVASATPSPTATASPGATASPTATATAPPSALGTFAAPPVFPPTGARIAQAVFLGGTTQQLDAALQASNATGAWAQTSDGTFYLYVVGAPSFVNAPFLQQFPNGFTSARALTIVGR